MRRKINLRVGTQLSLNYNNVANSTCFPYGWQHVQADSHALCLYFFLLQRPPERYNTEEDSEDVARSASTTKPSHGQGHQLTVPYSIPRALAVAPSLGGEPVSPELAVVSPAT